MAMPAGMSGHSPVVEAVCPKCLLQSTKAGASRLLANRELVLGNVGGGSLSLVT